MKKTLITMVTALAWTVSAVMAEDSIDLPPTTPAQMRSLGSSYENGDGVQQSYEEAVKWYRKAAEQGDAQAQFRLACCYAKGLGVQQSYEEAVEWCRKAADHG